ncbi:MAG TPA: hypothetical protein PKY50_04110 [Candidatus Competibacter sp.]|nr:hypothetical protein [Candidatus Competibacter sp.]
MAVAVTFDYKTKHAVERTQSGQVVARPAIPSSAGLYVIRNKDQARAVYAGTSSNLQQRFKGRFEVFRETGLTDAVLANIRIYIIKLKIDDQARAVDDTGIVYPRDGQIDVENLLIRSIVAKAHCNVFNVAKWQIFRNPYAQRLDVEFDNFPHSTRYFIPNNFNVPSNGTF